MAVEPSNAATLREYEVMQETITRRVFTVPATSENDAVKRWFHGEGEIARKETDEWKLYAMLPDDEGLEPIETEPLI